jgi:hypothetical protein
MVILNLDPHFVTALIYIYIYIYREREREREREAWIALVVYIVTDYTDWTQRNWGSIPWQGKEIFFPLLDSVQTSYGANQVIYPMYVWGSLSMCEVARL